jgi:hypothetical protein
MLGNVSIQLERGSVEWFRELDRCHGVRWGVY